MRISIFSNVSARAFRCLRLCLIVVVLPPIVIFVAYSFGEVVPLIVMPWSAGDALSYCGAVNAALLAMLGVYWGLRENRRVQEAQAREEAAPFFSVTVLEQQNKQDPFFDSSCNVTDDKKDIGKRDDEPKKEYIEVDNRTVYALLEDEISYVGRLSDAQLVRVQSRTLVETIAPGAEAIVANPVIYMPLQIENAGKGTAVGVRVGINPRESDWLGVKSWTINSGEHFYLGIYVDTENESVFRDYELRILFSDCLGYQYIQSFGLSVYNNSQGERGCEVQGTPAVQLSFIGTRVLLDADERKSYLNSVELIS